MNRYILFVAAVCSVTIAVPAFAGEVNGSTTNPKDDFSNGASICLFSGLNDDPFTESEPTRTQSYGQAIVFWGLDKEDPVEQPGFLCNPTILPMKPIGKP